MTETIKDIPLEERYPFPDHPCVLFSKIEKSYIAMVVLLRTLERYRKTFWPSGEVLLDGGESSWGMRYHRNRRRSETHYKLPSKENVGNIVLGVPM